MSCPVVIAHGGDRAVGKAEALTLRTSLILDAFAHESPEHQQTPRGLCLLVSSHACTLVS